MILIGSHLLGELAGNPNLTFKCVFNDVGAIIGPVSRQ